MSTETPETPVAATPPTPENVAAFLSYCANEALDDGGNLWFPTVKADGNTVEIAIKPADENGDALEEIVRFRAPVVPADAGPVVVASPTLLAAARALYRSHVASGSLPADQAAALAHELRDALGALTPDQMAVLAGDERDGDGDA